MTNAPDPQAGLARVRFLPSGREALVPRGAFLTAAAMGAGEAIVHDCDGQGVCGTCRVRIEEGAEALGKAAPEERAQLGPAAIAEGWRLCCRVRAGGDATVRVPEDGFVYPPELQREASPAALTRAGSARPPRRPRLRG